MTNEHSSLEKYTSHTLFERVASEWEVCERWVGDPTDCNILTPSSSVFSSTSFSFCWLLSWGSEGAALCWELVLTAPNSYKLTPTLDWVISLFDTYLLPVALQLHRIQPVHGQGDTLISLTARVKVNMQQKLVKFGRKLE